MLDGEFTITQNLFNVVTELFPPIGYPTLLETGSGNGTLAWLKAGYKVTSIENDRRWLRDLGDSHRFLHAPLVDGYFDRAIVRSAFQAHHHIWLLDGPPAAVSDRTLVRGLIDEGNYAQPDIFIVDDCHREDGQVVTEYLMQKMPDARRMDIENTDVNGPEHKAVIIIP